MAQEKKNPVGHVDTFESLQPLSEGGVGVGSRPVVQREKWSSRLDFMLSVAGGFIGLGNVWRFPYLCYKNGGGAFLIPYVIFLLGGGIPLFFMEVAVGQFTSQGGITCWTKICPLLTGVCPSSPRRRRGIGGAFMQRRLTMPPTTGVGYASVVIVSLMSVNYIIILAWGLFYLAHSFTSELPWATCNNTWNTADCLEDSLRSAANFTNVSATHLRHISPVIQFWERKVLGLTNGIEEVGELKWDLTLCMIAMWIVVFFCLWKGVKTTGKIVYFTATFPFLMLFILLIRGITLPGAAVGIKYYLYPDLTRLSDPEVWIDAGTQIFYSYAICISVLTSLGSYNKYHYNCYRSCLILSCMNSSTSFISGFAIFSILGFMAQEQGVDISQVAESGPGLAFIAYPKAVTMMPLPSLWAVLFFIMLLLLGLDSQFVDVEGQVTSLVDLNPGMLRKGYRRQMFLGLLCVISLLLGLTMVTKGGMYVFQLFDYFGASGICMLWVAFFECVAVAWLFDLRSKSNLQFPTQLLPRQAARLSSVDRFYDVLEDMLGFRPGPWMKWCWLVISPSLCLACFIFALVKFTPLTYNKDYLYPPWAQGVGWCLALASMLCVPGYAIIRLLMAEGSLKKRWHDLVEPQLKGPKYDNDEQYETTSCTGSDQEGPIPEKCVMLTAV